MRKQYFGRQFKRDANERKALFKNLLTSLVLEERIVTTEAKAKAIKGAADKLVTKAKIGGQKAMDRLAPDVRFVAVAKLVNTIAPRFTDRNGGYTRIIKLGNRVADNAPQVILEWVDRGERAEMRDEKSKKVVSKAVEKKEKTKATAKVATSAQQTKSVKNAAPKKTVTRQKKG